MKGELQHWPIICAAFVIQFLTHGYASIMGIFYVEWKKTFLDESVGSSTLGWLATSVLGVLLLSAVLSGALTHHYGVRPVIIFGGLLSTFGLFITSFAESVSLLFLTVPVMTGLGFGFCYAACLASIAQYFHKNFALASGIASTGISIGVITLPILTQALVDKFTWRIALRILAGIQAHVMVCGAIMRPPKPLKTKDKIETVIDQFDSSKSAKPESCKRISSDGNGKVDADVLHDKSLRSGICTRISSDINGEAETVILNSKTTDLTIAPSQSRLRIVLDSFGVSLIWTNRVYACYLPLCLLNGPAYSTALIYMKESAVKSGVSEFESSLLISIIGFSGLFSRAGFGYFLDAKIFHPATLYLLGNTMSATGILLAYVVDNFVGYVVCAAAIGFGAGLYIAINMILVRSMVGVVRFPGGMGLALMGIAVSIMSSVALTGWLLDHTGDYLAGFLYAGVIQGLCGILCIVSHLVWTRSRFKDPRWPPPVPSSCSAREKDRQSPENGE